MRGPLYSRAMVITLPDWETLLLASQAPSQTRFVWVLLLTLFCASMLLFVVAFILSLLRIARRQYARRQRAPETLHRRAEPDPWKESSARIPLEPEAPSERDPDQDLPPMGGRFQ